MYQIFFETLGKILYIGGFSDPPPPPTTLHVSLQWGSVKTPSIIYLETMDKFLYIGVVSDTPHPPPPNHTYSYNGVGSRPDVSYIYGNLTKSCILLGLLMLHFQLPPLSLQEDVVNTPCIIYFLKHLAKSCTLLW